MSSTKKTERLKNIIAYLKECNGASLKDIAHYLQISEMTARRDLYELRERNVIHYISGVAIFNPARQRHSEQYPYDLTGEKEVNSDKKESIGQRAAALIASGDTIIIDTGTTTEHFARHIPNQTSLTVLCYNINIMNELIKRPHLNLLFAGGIYHENTQMFESLEGLSLINRTRAVKVFLSAAGVSELLGITCRNHYEIDTKRAIINAALKRILLADSTKFNRIRPALFAQLSDLDTVITDNGISSEWIEILKKNDIELIIA